MRVIWGIFSGDVRNLFRNVIAAIVVMGLALVPPMYAWFTTLGFWDPYESTGHLHVCVVNEDEGADSELTGHIDVGEMIVDELHGEKMDIIVWSEDPAKFVASALSPADVKSVTVLPGSTKACRVIVPDDQLSLAIGKEGQNARLAARLTGYKIDIKPASQEQELEAIDAQPDAAPEDAEPQA